jgi:integrase
LTYLTQHTGISAATQRQAFNSLLFFYRHGLKKELGDISDTPRPIRRQYIPPTLSREEVNTLIGLLHYPYNLMAKILYGCGLRLGECTGLRIQDLNFDTNILIVHRGKGGKDRTMPLPKSIVSELHWPPSPNGFHPISCAIATRRIFYRQATTSAPFRSSSAIATSAPP